MLAAPSLDFHLTDSYFVVAHFHYVLFGGGGVRACSPASTTGTRSSPARSCTRAGATPSSCLMFIGFNMTFFVQHILGMNGMPRRTASYTAADGALWANLNLISTIGAMILGALDAALPLERVPHVAQGRAGRRQPVGRAARSSGGRRRPRGHGNFTEPLPRIRSERPVWDVNHPAHTALSEEHPKDRSELVGAGAASGSGGDGRPRPVTVGRAEGPDPPAGRRRAPKRSSRERPAPEHQPGRHPARRRAHRARPRPAHRVEVLPRPRRVLLVAVHRLLRHHHPAARKAPSGPASPGSSPPRRSPSSSGRSCARRCAASSPTSRSPSAPRRRAAPTPTRSSTSPRRASGPSASGSAPPSPSPAWPSATGS